MNQPPLSLYVHLPWCIKKCPYCDFNSHTATDAPKERYIDALLADLDQELKRSESRTLESIFLGGGTPSLFSPGQIGRILDGVASKFSIAKNAEVTMEANPGTVECGAPAGYRAAGINRLSIGAQSFDDAMLQALGRIHSSADVERAVRAAQDSGFDNLNIDLMNGLPGQSTEMALTDLKSAIALRPTHVSWYQLTLEPNTVFYSRPPADLPGDELAFEIQTQGQALLAESGYNQYEVSAYAQAGRSCQHNLNYWLFGDYLAIGAGAHGKLSRGRDIFRYRKPAYPTQYINAVENDDAAILEEPLAADQLMFEFMLNALRLTKGFSERIFCERTGLNPEALQAAANGAVERGLMVRAAGRQWRPTELGSRFLNDLQAEFLPGSS